MTLVRLIPTLILFSIGSSILAQETTPAKVSPAAIARIRYKDAYLKITYCQPYKRGREIFGKLVPYGQVWRTGANEATELTVTKDILINNILLRAGTYSLFTIPEKEKWTIIINNEVGLWGSYNYNVKMDAFRFEVPLKKTGTTFEAMTIELNQRNEVADLSISWDDVQVIIPIKFIN